MVAGKVTSKQTEKTSQFAAIGGECMHVNFSCSLIAHTKLNHNKIEKNDMKKQNELSHGENKERQSEGYSSKSRETTTAETHACHCPDRTKGCENTSLPCELLS